MFGNYTHHMVPKCTKLIEDTSIYLLALDCAIGHDVLSHMHALH